MSRESAIIVLWPAEWAVRAEMFEASEKIVLTETDEKSELSE